MDEESTHKLKDELNEECLVCFQPCKEMSVDLFLYSCKCIYPIHSECFKEWRSITGSSRVCLICREELDYANSDNESESESESELQTVVAAIMVPRGIEERIEEMERSCVKSFLDYALKLLTLGFIGFLIAFTIEILHKKNLS